MNKLSTALFGASLMAVAGQAVADEHEGEMPDNVATAVEIYTCDYNEGQGAKDLESVTKKWSKWADKRDLNTYTAWTMVPFYSGPNQDFDVIWLGGSMKAAELGRVQQDYLTEGGDVQEAFAEVLSCNSHSAVSALAIKPPPNPEYPKNGVVTFSDCYMAEGHTFDDLYVSLLEWGKYKAENGSEAGYWVFFPSFGGGGEDFSFKWVTAHADLVALGTDWDQQNEVGWQKAGELFQGKVSCDSSRTYLSTLRRQATQ